MLNNPPTYDPDIFARQRLRKRIVVTLVVQLLSGVASVIAIYFDICWNERVEGFQKFPETRSFFSCAPTFVISKINKNVSDSTKLTQLIETNLTRSSHLTKSNIEKNNQNDDDCCTQQLDFLYKKQLEKARDFSYFAIILAISATCSVFTITAYFTFINKSKAPYLRKLVLNCVCLLSLCCQIANCCILSAGNEERKRKEKETCELSFFGEKNSRKLAHDRSTKIVIGCLQKLSACTNQDFLYGIWVANIICTVLLSIVYIASCKFQQRVFLKLSNEVAFKQKTILHTLQRLQVLHVKTDLQTDIDTEKNLVAEQYQYMKALQESAILTHPRSNNNNSNNLYSNDHLTNAHGAVNGNFLSSIDLNHDKNQDLSEIVESYNTKLKYYNAHIGAILNKEEALEELRKFDLQLLQEFHSDGKKNINNNNE